MPRNPRYDVLFEPVRIGPVTAPNRFYQVPHASSTGGDMPHIRAGLRGIRAEGGWGVVCTGYCSIHPSADGAPHHSGEGYQEPYVAFAKRLTTKPVVGVGRFTSPDAMVSQLRRGVLDLIGAARPSIADPFLPAKIDAGEEDDIRECIGCNICYSCFHEAVPIRCTQNPTMGEEWRRGWHPERIAGPCRDFGAGGHVRHAMPIESESVPFRLERPMLP